MSDESKPHEYKEQTHILNVVAIKKGQTEINAPGHDTWGTVKCGSCSDEFLIGPSQIYGASGKATAYANRLEVILAREHQQQQPHQNNYDLGA